MANHLEPVRTFLAIDVDHGESSVTKGNHCEGLASDLAIYQKALSPEEEQKVMDGHFSFSEQ